MTSRTKRQSSAECALPSELGCPSIFSILRLTIQLTRSRPAKLVLTSVKKWARNCSAWGSFAQSTLSSGGPQHRHTVDLERLFGHPTASDPHTNRNALWGRNASSEGRNGARVGGHLRRRSYWAWPGTPSPVQSYAPSVKETSDRRMTAVERRSMTTRAKAFNGATRTLDTGEGRSQDPA